MNLLDTPYYCKSVINGWQTGHMVNPDSPSEKELTFGPSFNKLEDLWAWQGSNHKYIVELLENPLFIKILHNPNWLPQQQ